MNDNQLELHDQRAVNDDPALELTGTPTEHRDTQTPGGGDAAFDGEVISTMGSDQQLERVSEVDAAEAWGLNRDRNLRPIREKFLEKNRDWFRESRVIYLTRSGVSKISKKIGADAGRMWDAALRQGNKLTEKVTVVSFPREGRKWHFINRSVIQCRRENGDLINVIVRDSQNYRPRLQSGAPMTLQALWQNNQWIHVGRDPRSVGRW